MTLLAHPAAPVSGRARPSRLPYRLGSTLLAVGVGSGFLTAVGAPAQAAETADCDTRVCSTTFESTGAEQVFAVPAGVSTVQAVLVGGSGGAGGGAAGKGAVVTASVPVAAGSSLFVEVGGNGWTSGGGFNGGGGGGNNYGGGGGGASDLRTTSRDADGTLASRLVIAAGGGGGGGNIFAAYGGSGGDAGRLEGAAGTDGASYMGQGGGGGAGATQATGGAPGRSTDCWFCDGGSGVAGSGGDGGSALGASGTGGGGGGGYFGGGGAAGGSAADGGGGGGGGSSWAAAGVTMIDFGLDASSKPTVVISYTNPAPDTAAPVITSPADVTAAATGPDGAVVTYDLPTAHDVYDDVDVPVTCDPASGSVFAIGATTVTCTAVDGAGNTATSAFTVTVADDAAPVIIEHDNVAAAATGPQGAVVSYDLPLATDAVDGDVPVTCDPASGSVFPLGDTTVTCTATDEAGNTATTAFTVTVADTTAPVIAAAEDVTAGATGPDGAVVAYDVPAANDAVDGDVLVTCDPASGSLFGFGETVVSCAAVDSAGNTATTAFTVTVADSTAPVIASHDDVTVTATGRDGAVVSYTAPSATDAVDGAVAVTCLPASGSKFAMGRTTVSCAATDRAGNRSTSSFTVTVVENKADLKVGITGPSTAAVGSRITYTMTIKNNGPAAARDLSAVLATSGLSNVTVSAGGTSGSMVVCGITITGTKWKAASLASGESITVSVTGTVNVKRGSHVTALGGAGSSTPDPQVINNLSASSTRAV